MIKIKHVFIQYYFCSISIVYVEKKAINKMFPHVIWKLSWPKIGEI